jgi:FMN phosphatase YigB (HAD superfamily)
MVVCLVFDIDDTIYIHKSKAMNYTTIRPDYQLKSQLQRIDLPKFVLTNATYGHANIILNKLSIDDEFKKIYARDNIYQMKPSPFCYETVEHDISTTLQSNINKHIFFDDLLINLEYAKQQGWNTIWISPDYQQSSNYIYVDRGFSTLKDALDTLNFKTLL